MKNLSRWMVLLGIILVVGALSAFTMPEESSPDMHENLFWSDFQNKETSAAPSPPKEEGVPPTPNRNPCLHCHIVGYEDGGFTPLWRWLSFGTVGLIFLFGITSSLATWNTREPWKPVSARVSELVGVTDPLGKELDVPLPKWLCAVWYALGGLMFALFVVQAISGAVNWYHIDPLLFDPEMDTHAQLILGIKSVHWVVGIVSLAALLGFTFIGSLFKSAQRSFWTTMLIIGGVAGIPAIVQLTRGYLDPELVIPASHLYALHAVLVAALFASMTAMYFILSYKSTEA